MKIKITRFLFFILFTFSMSHSILALDQIVVDDCTPACFNYPDCLDATIDCISEDLEKECKEGCPNYPCCKALELPCGPKPCNLEPDCYPGSAEWPACAMDDDPLPLDVKTERENPEIGKYEKFEFGLLLTETFFNPYDPDLVSVEAEFISPSGLSYTVYGFHYQPFERKNSEPYWEPLPNDCPWRVRFAPNELGDWTYSVKIVEKEVTTYQSEVHNLLCISSDNPGPLEVSSNNRYFQFKDGSSFLGIAQDLRGVLNHDHRAILDSDCDINGNPIPNPLNCETWCFNINTLARHLQDIGEFKANGGNLVRIWIEPHTYEMESLVLNKYNYNQGQERAFDLDELIDFAGEQDVYIHLVLQGIGPFYRRDFSAQQSGWPINPYRCLDNEDGTKVVTPFDFFESATALEIYKKRIRYIIARWGYSTAIASYGLLNEPEFISQCDPNIMIDDCDGNPIQFDCDNEYKHNKTTMFDWFEKVGTYIQDISFYKKMISVDFASTSDLDGINASNIIDFTNTHIYSRDLNQNFQHAFELNHLSKVWGKPSALTETGNGIGWIAEPRNIDIHNSIWATGLSGQFSTSFFFGSNHKFNHPCYGNGSCMYLPFSKFMDGETFNSTEHTFLPISNAFSSFTEFVDTQQPGWNYAPPTPPANSDLHPYDLYGFALNRYGQCAGIIEESLTRDITTSDNQRIQAFALKNQNRVLGWVHNKHFYWYNVFRPGNQPNIGIGRSNAMCQWEGFLNVNGTIVDDIGPLIGNPGANQFNQIDNDVPILENETMTISGLRCNGNYQVEWYSTQCGYDIDGDDQGDDGGIIVEFTDFVSAADGVVTIDIPTLKPIEWTANDAEPFAPDYGFKLIYISGASDNGMWKHDWPDGEENDHQVTGDIAINLNNDNNQIFYRGEEGFMRHFFPNSSTDWIYGGLNHWVQPASHKIAEDSPIRVNSKDQVFYKGEDEKLQYYYWTDDGAAGFWTHDWVGGEDGNFLVKGDIVINSNNDQIFYRDQDYYMKRFTFTGGTWVQDDLGFGTQPYDHKIFENSPIRINSLGQVFYKGGDQKMQYYYFDGSQWQHDWPGGEAANHKVNGDIVINTLNGNDQIFYRNPAGFMRHFFPNGQNSFIHGALNHWTQPNKHKIFVNTPIRINSLGQVFYKGGDQKMQYYYFDGFQWQHDWPGGEAANHKVNGDITINTINDNNQIFYRNAEGFMRHFFPNGQNSFIHGALNHWVQPNKHKIYDPISPIRINTNGQVFYKGEDEKMQYYYWDNPCFHEGSGRPTKGTEGSLPPTAEVKFNENDLLAKEKLIAYPNPSNTYLTIDYQLDKKANIQLYLMDIYGKQQTIIKSAESPAGNFTETIATHNYPSGVYILHYSIDNQPIKSQKIVINH